MSASLHNGVRAETARLLVLAHELLHLAAAARHGPDFSSVAWFGHYYTFTASQARVIAVLWAAWENGTPDVRQETLLEAAGSESNQLSNLFAGNPAWKTAIVPGPLKGLFRLAEPVGNHEESNGSSGDEP